MSKFMPTLDSHYVDVSEFDNVEIGNKEDLPIYKLIEQRVFPGAWYHKVVAPVDNWIGIEGEIELGEFTGDLDRFNMQGLKRFQDNPSVYMGGHALYESDCGLGYNCMYEDDDTSEELTLESPKLGWKPFWRYIYKEIRKEGGNCDVINVNSWNVSDPKATCYYYFPGDVIRMKVYSPIPNYMQLRIEVVKSTTIEKYVKLREKYHLVDNKPLTFYSPLFISEGQGCMPCELKRVNSIDQYGNEGKPSSNTKASVSEATWYNCYLYKRINGKIKKYPFTADMQEVVNCPSVEAFTFKKFNSESGGEKITIHPITFHFDA